MAKAAQPATSTPLSQLYSVLLATVAGVIRSESMAIAIGAFGLMHRTSLLFIGLLATCSPAVVPTAPLQPDDSNTIVIGAAQFGTTVVARVGQILLIPRPADHETWHVSYSSEIVRPLVADEAIRNPGNAGWRFRVIGSGESDLSFEPIPPGEKPAAGIAQQRFLVTIQASD
jgi:hypothetical protein